MNSEPAIKISQEPSFLVKKVGEVSKAFVIGAVFKGYLFYWIARLRDNLGHFGDQGGSAIKPLPFIFCGIVNAAHVQTAHFIYDFAVYLLGENSKTLSASASAIEKLRSRCWTVIGKGKKLTEKVDQVFSNIFQIRTAKEIRVRNLSDPKLYLMEIFRRSLGQQLGETASLAIPQELSAYIVEGLGFTVLGVHMGWLHAIGLLGGTLTKFSNTIKTNRALEELDEDVQNSHWSAAHKKYDELLKGDWKNEEFQLGFAETFIKELQKVDRNLSVANMLNKEKAKEEFENFETSIEYILNNQPPNPTLSMYYAEALAIKIKFGLFNISDELDKLNEKINALNNKSPPSADETLTLDDLKSQRTEILQETEASLIKSLEEKPENVICLGKYSWVLLQQGKVEEAQKKCEEALKIDKANPFILAILDYMVAHRQQ